jgi:hypothetical protein
MKHSEQINELAAALSLYQRGAKNPNNSAKNPFLKNKYAPLNEILNQVRPELAEHGLAITQLVTGDGVIGVTTILMHASGQWIGDSVSLQPDSNKGLSVAQNAGVVITYLRRYGVQAILGISGEDDTDGHSEPSKPTKPRTETIDNESGQTEDYSRMHPDDIEAKYLPLAIKQEISKVYEPTVAYGFRDEANNVRQKTDKEPEYRKLLSKIRKHNADTTEPEPGPDLPESAGEELF